MKKSFTIPKMEIIYFENDDVVTSSAIADDIFSVKPSFEVGSMEEY